MSLVQNIILNATIRRSEPATIMGDRVHTWSEFVERVSRAAAGLRDMGIKEGDRVGIMALNSDRYLEALFAINWAGAVSVPMNIRWSLEENVYSAKDSGLRVLIADDQFADGARAMRAEVISDTGEEIPLIHMGDADAPEGFVGWDTVVDKHEGMDAVEVPYSSLSGIFYTGGTTGFPKGVMLSYLALWSSAMTLTAAAKVGVSTRYLHAAPMFHLADAAFSNSTTIAGGTHVFIPAFTAAGTLQAVTDKKVTTALLVPTMIGMLLQAPEFGEADVSSLRTLVYGASPMPEPILLDALKKLPHVSFYQGYGQTEMAPLVSLLPPENHVLEGPASKLRSAGLPIGCVQVQIMDEDGVEVARGEPGEIWVRGPNAMDGYWNKPAQTADAMVNGWVKTGDVAYQDEDGFLFICDRAKDMVITGGENVFSAEVENAVLTHDNVAEVAVIGVPDDKFGERVHAVIVPVADAADITQEEIYEHCRELIAGYKCPRSIEIRNEPLPLSGAGKVLKKDLRAPHWEGKGKGVA